jgi:Uma2 family endonuclease
MAQAIATDSSLLTFEQYRFYEGEPGIRYELFRGRLIPMPTPSGLHTNICAYLVYQFQRYIANHDLTWVAKTDAGVRTEEDSSRIPDVVVCSETLWEQVCARPGAGILDFEEVPQLVVEVVSENWREDYIRKRAEYALIDIPEYWIVDPKRRRVWVLTNPQSQDSYDRREFLEGNTVRSEQFPDLLLQMDEVLNPPIVENLVKQEAVERQQLQERAEQAEQRAEQLAARLRELGVGLDSI